MLSHFVEAFLALMISHGCHSALYRRSKRVFLREVSQGISRSRARPFEALEVQGGVGTASERITYVELNFTRSQLFFKNAPPIG
jgi:hypothetical protein